MTAASAQRAVEAAREAARRLGLDPAGAVILREAAAITVELPGAAAVARVEPPECLAVARRQAIVARILEQRCVPAARLLASERQPLVLSGGVVTLWRRLRILPGVADPETLGRLARQLHTACAEGRPAETPPLDPFAPIPGWRDRPSDLPPPPGADRLWELLEELRQRWPETVAGDPLGTTLVHGDLHADNVVLTPEGAKLLDLELAGKGPASWDLMVQELAVRRYGGAAEDLLRFYEGYGAELPTWDGVELLRRSYELHLVAWAVAHRDVSPAMAEQARIRLATLLGESDEPWTLI